MQPKFVSIPGKKIGREVSFEGEKTDYLWMYMTAKKAVKLRAIVNFKSDQRRRPGT